MNTSKMEGDSLNDEDEWDIEKAIREIKRRKRYNLDEEANSDDGDCEVSEFMNTSKDGYKCDSDADSYDVSEFVETEMCEGTLPLTEAQQQLNTFWPKVTEEIRNLSHTDMHNQEFPLARIKRIMKLDEGKSISMTAPVVFRKAVELFITDLTLRAWIHTDDDKRLTLQRNDIAMAVAKCDQYDFLVDFVPRDDHKPTTKTTEDGNHTGGSTDHYIPIAPHYQPVLNQLVGSSATDITQFTVSVTNQSRQPQTKVMVQADGQVVLTTTNNDEPPQQSQPPLEDRIFYKGRAFTSYKDICMAKEMYQKQNNIIIVKKCSRKFKSEYSRNIKNVNPELIFSELIYVCVHSGGIRPNRKGKKQRSSESNTNHIKKKRKTSTYKWQCPFKLVLYLSRDGQTLIVANLLEEHNHICSSLICDQLPHQRRLDAETLEETKMLLALNVDKKKVQQYLYSKGKMVTIKDLHNLMRKVSLDKKEQQHLYSKGKLVATKELQNLMRNEVKKSDSFEDVLALMMTHQDISFEMLITRKSICQGIFFQTEAMKLTFNVHNEIIFIDSTYKLNDHSMPLYVMLCLDGNGESEVIALALVQFENRETLSWIAESFRKYNPNFMKVKYIMADRDMLERQVLLDHFPNAQLLICQFFHTLQAFKREVTTTKMDISTEERDFSLEIIQNILFAEDKATCDSNITLLKEMAPKMVVNYFTKIWEAIKDDWVRGLKSESLNFFQSTISKVDIFSGKLKSLIKSYSTMTQFFTDLLTVIRHSECERNRRTVNTLIKRPTDVIQNIDLGIPYTHTHIKEEVESTLTHPITQVLTVSHFLSNPSPSSLSEPIFYIGKAFTSYEDICTAKEMYEKQNKINLVKKCSERLTEDTLWNAKYINQELIYSEISYSCMHGADFKEEESSLELYKASELNTQNVNKKRKTSTYKWQCPFKMDLYLSKDSRALIVFNLQEEHNHICDSSIHDKLPQQRRLDAKTLEETKMLLSHNVDKKVQQHLSSKEKLVSMKDVYLMRSEVNGSNYFEDILVLLENHELSFEKFISKENVCRGIFFQTEAMKITFDAYSEIIFIDTTYKLNEISMPLYVMRCLDGNGDSEVIALALVQYENKETLSWIAESFRKYNPNFMNVKFIMADKDMLERQVLLKHFPNARLLLCLIQTLQTFRREVSITKMDISAEERDSSLKIIQNIVFSSDKATCNSKITLLVETAPKKVVDCFIKIWETIKDDWIRGLQSQTLHFYQSTNIRVKKFYGKLKSLIKSFSSMTDFFLDLMRIIRHYECEHRHQAIDILIKHPTDMVQNKNLAAYGKLLTPYAYKKLREQMESMKEVIVKEEPSQNSVIIKCSSIGEIIVTAKECPCGFKTTMSLPCQHILRARQLLGLSVFSEELCNKRWCQLFYDQNQRVLSQITLKDESV